MMKTALSRKYFVVAVVALILVGHARLRGQAGGSTPGGNSPGAGTPTPAPSGEAVFTIGEANTIRLPATSVTVNASGLADLSKVSSEARDTLRISDAGFVRGQ